MSLSKEQIQQRVANADILAAQTAAFVANQKKGKKRHRSKSTPSDGDALLAAAVGQKIIQATEASNVPDHHHSNINPDNIVLQFDKRETAKKAPETAASIAKKMKVCYRKTDGSVVPLKMEIAPFVLGTTSRLNWEGTYGLKKEKKEEENARSDCYFRAIMWAGMLEGRPTDQGLLKDQQDCLLKIYLISKKVLELMFKEPAYAQFRNASVDWARTDMKADYIKLSPKLQKQERPVLSQTDYEALEAAHPELLEAMLVHARDNHFLQKTNQFPCKPTPEETKAGMRSGQMFSIRQKVWNFQDGKFNAETDQAKKYDPFPGVVGTMANWGEVYRVMTDTAATSGRRQYSPIVYINGFTGLEIERPLMTVTYEGVDAEGKRGTIMKKVPNPEFNPMFEKFEAKIADGRVIEEKKIKINSMMACVVTFEPYTGPKQYGCRIKFNGPASHIDHVPWTPSIVVTQAAYARDYGHDDVVEVEVPKTAQQVAAEINKKNKKSKTAAVTDDGDSSGDYDSDSYESDDDNHNVGAGGEQSNGAQQPARGDIALSRYANAAVLAPLNAPMSAVLTTTASTAATQVVNAAQQDKEKSKKRKHANGGEKDAASESIKQHEPAMLPPPILVAVEKPATLVEQRHPTPPSSHMSPAPTKTKKTKRKQDSESESSATEADESSEQSSSESSDHKKRKSKKAKVAIKHRRPAPLSVDADE